jgi:hypothetical protein
MTAIKQTLDETKEIVLKNIDALLERYASCCVSFVCLIGWLFVWLVGWLFGCLFVVCCLLSARVWFSFV